MKTENPSEYPERAFLWTTMRGRTPQETSGEWNGPAWNDPVVTGDAIEYVRADVHAAEVARLKTALEQWRQEVGKLHSQRDRLQERADKAEAETLIAVSKLIDARIEEYRTEHGSYDSETTITTLRKRDERVIALLDDLKWKTLELKVEQK